MYLSAVKQYANTLSKGNWYNVILCIPSTNIKTGKLAVLSNSQEI